MQPPDDAPEPTAPDGGRGRFSGWRMVVLAAVVMGVSGPGQTAGVSVLIDPMLASLELSRAQFSSAYLIGTLAGATAMPRIGRFVDDHGPRRTVLLVGAGFGVVLAAIAGVRGIVALTLGFVGIRMLGQGALPLVATTAVAPWFRRRRGLAIGVTTALGTALISLFPLATTFVIGLVGWRATWIVLGVVAILVLTAVGGLGMIDRPADVGQYVDGEPPSTASAAADRAADDAAFTRGEAVRTPMFWAVTGAVATTGMIGTAMQFHQIDLLGEQGLSTVEAAANFLPQTAAGLLATVVVGVLVDRVAARWVLLGSMTLLATAMLAVGYVGPGAPAVAYGVVLGAAGASARSLEAASFPRLYGIRHLGAIRGVVTAVMVASTAFGPLLLAVGHDTTGSYVQVLTVLAVLPALVAVFGLLAPAPTRR